MLNPFRYTIWLTVVAASFAYRNHTASDAVVSGQLLSSPSQYDFPILQNGYSQNTGHFPMPLCHGITLEEATIDQLQDYMANGKLTSLQMTMCYIQRILQTDEYTR